jgi:methionyl-tRNA formyltransferase
MRVQLGVLVVLFMLAGIQCLRLGGRGRVISTRRPLGVLLMTTSSISLKPKQKVVFLGTPDVAATSLEMIVGASKMSPLNDLFEVVAVVSQPPAPAGRKKKLTPSPVQVAAERMGIPVLVPEKAKDEDFLTALEGMQPDLCITAAYGQWLPKRFLSIPRRGTLNIHPSLLPLFRGAAPVQRCLERGDDITGVSVAETVLKMDSGPIARQVTRPLQGDEKADDLLFELFVTGTNELLDVLPAFFDESNPIQLTPQDHDKACPADKITVEEARVDFAKESALTVHNRGRGFAGWPGIWSNFRIIANNDDDKGEGEEERIKIITTTVLATADSSPSAAATRIVEVVKYQAPADDKEDKQKKQRDILSVVCSDGSRLGILELQPPGKKVMDAKSFVNGLRGRSLEWVPLDDDEQSLG